MLALVGAVIVVSALLSGWVDRTGVPQVAVFLGIGALIGPIGLGLLDATAGSPILRVVATVSLVLVLFTDAVSLDLKEVRQHRLLAGLVLGPGTILFTAILSAVAHYLLGLSWPLAAILSAAIASTDPVLLRGVLKRPALHNGVRQALRLESGLNDVVLLPVVLVSIALLASSEPFTGGRLGTPGAEHPAAQSGRRRGGRLRRRESARVRAQADGRAARLRIDLFAGPGVRGVCRRGIGPRQRLHCRVRGRADDLGARRRVVRLLPGVRRDHGGDGAAVHVRAVRHVDHLERRCRRPR